MTDVRPLHPPGYIEELDRLAAEQANGTAPARRYPGYVRAIDAPPQEPLRWIIDEFWPATEIGLLVGDGGAFKSSAAVHIGGAIAGGYPVFDRYASLRRPVLIVTAEDQMSVVLMRLEAFIVGHGWDRDRVMENVFIIATDVTTVEDIELGDACFSDAGWRLHLKALVEEIRPGFIILDPWAELLGADENSNTEVRPAIKYLRKLAVTVDAAIAVVHHMGKMSEGKRQVDRIRGASALNSASRVTFFFEFQPDAVRVENLKMSRTPRLQSFVIKRDIDSDPANRAQWTRARFSIESAARFERTKAEQFVIAQLRLASPRELKTNDLKTLAKGGSGVRNADITTATATLLREGIIGQEDGRQGAKLWYLIGGSAPRNPGNDDDLELQLSPQKSSSRESGPVGPVSNSGKMQAAQPAPSSSGLASGQRAPATAPPVRGAGPVEPLPGGEFELLDEDDIQALIDEDLGKREEE